MIPVHAYACSEKSNGEQASRGLDDMISGTSTSSSTPVASGRRPAEALEGLTTNDGWTIASRIPPSPGATGATFSVPYVVERSQSGKPERAFLKALDIAKLLEMGLPIADAINSGTTAYLHERALVLKCSERRMANVVRALSAGELIAPMSKIDPIYGVLTEVPYLIFEIADGDIRAAIERRSSSAFDEAWALKMLHGIAKGIRQLHQREISHQDLKPSNVMTFDNVAKVGDLGRSSDDAAGGLWSGQGINGDSNYAPPELLYNEMQPDDRIRRRACDMYHVGSMVSFLLAGTGMTALLNAELPEAFHWRSWPKTYRNVLPYVRDAFDRALTDVSTRIRDPLRADVITVIREMCEPDPLLRGTPQRSDVARYSLERYISIFDRLSKKADIWLTQALE
jgi:eukaryotic-like serine/threonine-protein kinase